MFLVAGALMALTAPAKTEPAPAPKVVDDPTTGGSGGGALEGDDAPVPAPDAGGGDAPDTDTDTQLPTLEEDDGPLAWDQILPCATDLEGFVLDPASFAAIGERSVVVLFTCERETELEAEFHLACAEDDSDTVDYLVLHEDDIDWDDPDMAIHYNDIMAMCEGKQGAFGVMYYDPEGPRLLSYDGFDGAAADVLSYPTAPEMELDAFDVVDMALTLAHEGKIPGIDGTVFEGHAFADLLY